MRLSRESRILIRTAKKVSWESFISQINNDTTSVMYKKLKSMGSAGKSHEIDNLIFNNCLISDPKRIANELADQFTNVSKIARYEKDFVDKMSNAERTPLDDKSEVENFNQPFTLLELEIALKNAKGSSPGPDKIHYNMMKNLTEEGKLIFLNLTNRIWTHKEYPKAWRKTFCIPILKVGKDGADPTSYRPIQLECVPSKVMEKMASKRLNWCIENFKMISDDQSGFRAKRSTLDAIMKMQTEIQEGWKQKQISITLHFDIEKAYDTVWRYNVLQQLEKKKIGGNLFYYAKNFMSERTSQTIVKNQLSEEKNQETGLVQGAVMSVPLFLIAMHGVAEEVESLSDEITKVSYADDLTIVLRGKELSEIEGKAQEIVNFIEEKAKNIGFRISGEKTKFMIFSKRLKTEKEVNLYMGGSKIERVKEIKCLGFILDDKFLWKKHIEYVAIKARKRLNVLKMIKSKKFGVKRDLLLKINQSIILSVLDYGSELYDSASKTAKRKLNAILNNGLRIATGAFVTSPTISLQAEAGCLPLDLRRKLHKTRYAIRMFQNPNNPNARPPKTSKLKPKNNRKCIWEEMNECIIVSGIKGHILREPKIKIPIWEAAEVKINIKLSTGRREEKSSFEQKSDALEELDRYRDYFKIYTDGSKQNEKVAYGLFSEKFETSGRLQDGSSIFSAEMYAIYKAVEYIKSESLNKALIVSDSLSSLKALQNPEHKETITCFVRQTVLKLKKEISFLWVPSHVGIFGNEQADKMAKEGLKKIECTWVTIRDGINICKKKVWEEFQQRWNEVDENNKLKRIKTKLDKSSELISLKRKDAVIITRLRIGHSRKTHEFLFKKEKITTKCQCNENLTVKHILEDCEYFKKIREKHNVNMKKLKSKKKKNLMKIIEYLKEIRMYHDI
jgi:ribonuclease HI